MGEKASAATLRVEQIILTVRGQRVILDSDLAAIYGVPTRTLNQAVKRNAGRFPVDFAFQLAPEEVAVCGRKWPAQPGEPTGHSL